VNRLTEIERQEIYSINLDDLQRRLNIKIQDISDQLSVRTMNILNILKFLSVLYHKNLIFDIFVHNFNPVLNNQTDHNILYSVFTQS
jgi:hypothetical protein